MDIEPTQLEVYLLRTLPPKSERRFNLGTAKLVRSPIGCIPYQPGDIIVGKPSKNPNMTLFEVIPKTSACIYYGNHGDLGGSFTRMTIENTQPNIVVKDDLSLAWFKCTLESDFAPAKVLEIRVDDGVRLETLSFCELAIAELRSGSKGCIFNKNRLCITNASGVSTYFVLSGHLRVQVRSLGFSDIINSLSRIDDDGDFNAESLSLWRPLLHFWMDEAFAFRAAAHEVYEHSKSETPEEAANVHGVLRLVVRSMIRVREVIYDSIVDQFLRVATELGVSHSSLGNMLKLKDHVHQLQRFENGGLLGVSLLDRLAEFDLKKVLPLFNHEFTQLLADLGPDFSSTLKHRFQDTPGAPNLIEDGRDSKADAWNQIGHSIWLTALAKCTTSTQSEQMTHETEDMESSKPAEPRQVLVLKPNLAWVASDKYRITLFHGMPNFYNCRLKQGSEVSEFESDAIDKLKSILFRSQAFVIKSQKLLCWNASGKWKDNTTFWFAELDRLEKRLLGTSDPNDTPNEPWIHSKESGFRFYERRCIDFAANTACVIYSGRKEILADSRRWLSLIKFVPKCLEHEYELSPDPWEFQRQYSKIDDNSMNPYHFGLNYCSKLQQVFFALTGMKGAIGYRKQKLALGVTLVAYSIPEYTANCNNTLSTIAMTWFDLRHLPTEVCYPWEFPAIENRQGLTNNTSSVPFSPLRWCSSRLNMYCVWLLSPRSLIIFGFKKDRFVQLSVRINYRSFDSTPIFVLPEFSKDHFGGMMAFFEGRRYWDVSKKRLMVAVYKLKLHRS